MLFSSLSWLSYSLVVILGLVVGSFINSLVWRLRVGVPLFPGRSVCVHCERTLAWYENIPIASYVAVGGKCRTCSKAIPSHYLWVELATATSFVVIMWHYWHIQTDATLLVKNLIFSAFLIFIFLFDFLYQLVLPAAVWSGTVIGLAFNLAGGHNWQSLALGAVVAGGFFLAQFVISHGRWIGGGDVRLGVMMGIWLGLSSTLVALFAAYVVGATVSLLLVVTRKRRLDSAVPFGTYLALGTFIALLWGNQILSWYINFLS